jgi:hypothetical protein
MRRWRAVLGPNSEPGLSWRSPISRRSCGARRNSAFQLHQEDFSGRLVPGMAADLVIADRGLEDEGAADDGRWPDRAPADWDLTALRCALAPATNQLSAAGLRCAE